ncbi:AHH domain-containing protein [Bacteroides xylanisolvens]|nr:MULTISPECIES: AHH domain-containing protein [Bacteroides]MCS2843828.1 AHH domain-containing protein [Bacteroides uniformis]UVQ13691.1 AHH domain-containing protein [Bacteroides xylanisolvens]
MKRRKGFERHHIIPYHLKDHPIIVESGININGATNMIFLPRYESNHPTKMTHRHFRIGNEHHSAYDKEIEIELYKLSMQARLEKWSPEMMRQKILQLQHKKRRQLNNRNSYKK